MSTVPGAGLAGSAGRQWWSVSWESADVGEGPLGKGGQPGGHLELFLSWKTSFFISKVTRALCYVFIQSFCCFVLLRLDHMQVLLLQLKRSGRERKPLGFRVRPPGSGF